MTSDSDRTQATLRALAKDLEDVREVAELAAKAGASAQLSADMAKGLATSAHQAIAQVADGLARVNRNLADLAASVDGDQDEETETKGQISWLTLGDQDTAQAVMANLVGWLAEVYTRYPAGQLPECWSWHPSVISELLACQAAWAEAYQGRYSSPRLVVDWLDRHRPGVARRVGAELDGCSVARHGATGDLAYRPPRVAGAGQAGQVASWWVATHGEEVRAPEPNAQTVQEEKTRLDAAHQARY